MHNNYTRTFWPQVTTLELENRHLIYMLTIDLIWESNLIDFTHFCQIHKELNAFHVLKINLHWTTASYLLDLFTLFRSTLHELQARDQRPETIEMKSMVWMLNPQKVCLEKLEIDFNQNWWHVFGDYVMFVEFHFVEFQSDKAIANLDFDIEFCWFWLTFLELRKCIFNFHSGLWLKMSIQYSFLFLFQKIYMKM